MADGDQHPVSGSAGKDKGCEGAADGGQSPYHDRDNIPDSGGGAGQGGEGYNNEDQYPVSGRVGEDKCCEGAAEGGQSPYHDRDNIPDSGGGAGQGGEGYNNEDQYPVSGRVGEDKGCEGAAEGGQSPYHDRDNISDSAGGAGQGEEDYDYGQGEADYDYEGKDYGRGGPAGWVEGETHHIPEGSRFEYLDHTADVQLHGWGDTLKESFEWTAMAMFAYMTDIRTVEKLETQEIEAEGDDLESLLFHFLDELLFLFSAEPFFIAREVKITEFDEVNFKIKAIGYGETFDLLKHPQGTEVKAITYSAMQVHADKPDNDVYVIIDI